MSDILDRLRGWASIQADGSRLGADLSEAMAEIERLRGLAGAVSVGPSFSEIKAHIGDPNVDNLSTSIHEGMLRPRPERTG